MHTVRIWDLPTRLFHWLLVLCVVGLVVSANVGGAWMAWHFRFGYSVLTLLLFRVIWGLIGGHWSRFGSFLYGPASLWRHLRGQSPAAHTAGHSPLGALSVFALRDTDLTKIESRPIRGRPWEYLFYVDLPVARHDLRCARALVHLAEFARSMRTLGSYPSWKSREAARRAESA